MHLEEYDKLLQENFTKTYKHAPTELEASIDFEAKHLHSKLALSGRNNRLEKTPAYITLKKHKEKFNARASCRLMNPCNIEIGEISKPILEGINNNSLEKLNINQWRDTSQVIGCSKN